MYILIFGSGDLGQAVAKCCVYSGSGYDFHTNEGRLTPGSQPETLGLHKKDAVVIHCGEGQELLTAVEWCVDYQVPLLQVSKNLMLSAGSYLASRPGVVIEASDYFLKDVSPDGAGKVDLENQAETIFALAESINLLKETFFRQPGVYHLGQIIHFLLPQQEP